MSMGRNYLPTSAGYLQLVPVHSIQDFWVASNRNDFWLI